MVRVVDTDSNKSSHAEQAVTATEFWDVALASNSNDQSSHALALYAFHGSSVVVHKADQHLPPEQKDEQHRCTLKTLCKPSACFSAVCVIFFASALSAARSKDSAEAARFSFLILQFVGMASFTSAIVDSYPLATAVDASQAYSGLLVGAYMFGWFVGQGLCWWLLRTSPEVWKSHSRLIIGFGLLCNSVGACLYIATGLVVGEHAALPHLPQILVASRLLGGLGSGPIGQLATVCFQRLTPSADRPTQMTRFYFERRWASASGQ